MEGAATANIEKKPVKLEDITRSPELENLFTTRKQFKREEKYVEANKIIYKIRKQICKDRLDKTIKDLEDNLWHDIKKTKTAFVSLHAKLLDHAGNPCTSDKDQTYSPTTMSTHNGH